MTDRRFFCLPLVCHQSVAGCVARHAAATRAGTRGVKRLESRQCVGCRVGEGHAAGRMVRAWATGERVERIGGGR